MYGLIERIARNKWINEWDESRRFPSFFFFDKLGRTEEEERENDSAIALKEQDIFPLKTIFRIYKATTSRPAGRSARPEPNSAAASSNLKLPLSPLSFVSIAVVHEPGTWLYVTWPYITHYITPYVSRKMLARNSEQDEGGGGRSRVTHRQIDFLTTPYVILYARVSRARITYRLVAPAFSSERSSSSSSLHTSHPPLSTVTNRHGFYALCAIRPMYRIASREQ